jgi:hypothetical protein
MIPESEQNRTVDLYRASRFPDEWHLEETLFSGLRAVDSTVHKADGRLWLFDNVAAEGHRWTMSCTCSLRGDLIERTRSLRPFDQHVRQVVCYRARAVTDCSDSYGRAIVLNRVDVLSTREYRETVIGRVEPTWLPRLSGTHTLNVLDSLEAIGG